MNSSFIALPESTVRQRVLFRAFLLHIGQSSVHLETVFAARVVGTLSGRVLISDLALKE
jgi:hypothetical protein